MNWLAGTSSPETGFGGSLALVGCIVAGIILFAGNRASRQSVPAKPAGAFWLLLVIVVVIALIGAEGTGHH